MKSTLVFIIFFTFCYLSLQNGFTCNIPGCQTCSFPNICGLCQTNYILTLNTSTGSFSCPPVNCPVSCNYCYQNGTCQQCNQGFFITSNGSCSTTQTSSNNIPPNCLYGTNNQTCTICSYGFSLEAGFCYPTIQLTGDDTWCLVKMTPSICQICTQGFIVNPVGKCVNNTLNQNNCFINNCAYCNGANSTCGICYPGFQLTQSGTCTQNNCNIPGCTQCASNGSCSVCALGYLFNKNTQTCISIGYGCNMIGCAFCSGPQSCGQCQPGYSLVSYSANGTLVNLCKVTPCPYNITNCLACVPSYDSIFNFNKLVCAPNRCAANYKNVNGYCVPNIPGVPYNCSVGNCSTCSYNNFCSVCNPGFYLTKAGTCQSVLCSAPNCQSCSLNNICQQCNSGFSLALGPLFWSSVNKNLVNFLNFTFYQQCIPSTISCNIQYCAYCQTNNVCSMCAKGYDFAANSSTCVPICSTPNCFQCVEGNQNQCAVCNPAYNLQNGGCIAITFSCNSGCANGSCIYNWNTQAGQCTQCLSTFTLYSGVCYAQKCNIYGCLLCSTWTAPAPVVCLICQQGLIQMNGYCMIPNCNNSVANCANCIQNGKCIACKAGFNLQNNSGTVTCVPNNSTCVPNCLSCSATGTCLACATPYTVLNGQCVCSFQNCLDCSQSGLYCNWCPQPLYASLQQPGCTPQPSLNYNLNCSVSNCEYCLSSTQCSICAIGYKLTPGLTCTQNDCASLGLQNCQLCDQWGLECHLCQTNYTLDNSYQGGSCYLANNANYTCNITGCTVCSSANNSICSACLPTFYANGNNQCIPYSCNISNCYLCLLNSICTVCDLGYYLANDMTCQPFYTNIANCQGQITYCQMCVIGLVNNSTQTYCLKCQDGFEFDSVNNVCVPQTNSIPNCKIQTMWGYKYQPYCFICEQGYFVNAFGLCSPYGAGLNNTACNVYNCLYCAVNSTTCSFCLAPWGISLNGKCQTNITKYCPSNCVLCANSTVCYTCASTYLPNSSGSCILCDILGCTQCQTTSNVCTTCTTLYQLISSTGVCVLCNVTNCITCSGHNVCSNCGNGTFLSSSGGQCVNCDKTQPGLSQCQSCSSNNSCGVCNTGYQIYTTNNVSICVQCNITNCITCNQNNVCYMCITGYTQVNGDCVPCLYPCTTCNLDGGCAQCSTPFYFQNPLANGSCVVNTIANCISYNSTNTSMCTGCNTDYILSNNLCVFNCPLNCVTCSSTTVCTVCISGFYVTTNSSCSQCSVPGCSNCNGNSSSCMQCLSGYTLQSGQCTQCPSYCSACSFDTNNNVVCTSLSSSSQQQVLINQGSQTVLAVCQQNCLTCSDVNPLTCIVCASGFYLSNGNCMQCSATCLTCNSTNPSQCFSCYPNSFLVGKTCSNCNSNCLTCLSPNDPTTCTSCFIGYSLSSTKTCVLGCPNNCLYCSSANVCTLCNSGYTLFTQGANTVCGPCLQTCRTCAMGQPSVCLTCGAGFYLSGTSCIPCAINCNQCSAAGCLNCVSGYFLNSANTCSANCIVPCATCSSVNPTKCLSCIAGYSLNSVSNSCNQILSCSGACFVCPFGYTLNLGKCLQCTGNQCQSCQSSNPAVCTSCIPGFFLNSVNNQCQACSTSCATCLSASGCLTCAAGYTTILFMPITLSGYQCIACNSPCATCINNPNQCTSCISGYQFSGWKCTQAFHFFFTITLLTTLPTFNQNYLNFINALTSAINGPTSNIITITTITTGSVVVKGQAAPDGDSGTKQVNSQYNSFDASLATNNQLAGMVVGSSSVTVVNGSIDYTQINLALILGICIPVGVLIIAGIVLYIYCKKKRSADNILSKIQQDSGLNVRQSFQLSANYRDSSKPFQQNTAIN